MCKRKLLTLINRSDLIHQYVMCRTVKINDVRIEGKKKNADHVSFLKTESNKNIKMRKAKKKTGKQLNTVNMKSTMCGH